MDRKARHFSIFITATSPSSSSRGPPNTYHAGGREGGNECTGGQQHAARTHSAKPQEELQEIQNLRVHRPSLPLSLCQSTLPFPSLPSFPRDRFCISATTWIETAKLQSKGQRNLRCRRRADAAEGGKKLFCQFSSHSQSHERTGSNERCRSLALAPSFIQS